MDTATTGGSLEESTTPVHVKLVQSSLMVQLSPVSSTLRPSIRAASASQVLSDCCSEIAMKGEELQSI